MLHIVKVFFQLADAEEAIIYTCWTTTVHNQAVNYIDHGVPGCYARQLKKIYKSVLLACRVMPSSAMFYPLYAV